MSPEKREKISVLLIEDDEPYRIFVQEALAGTESVRCEVQAAPRLEEGLQKLQESQFHLVLLDLGLPDSRGLETFTHLHEEAPEVPVVMLTGLDDAAMARRALRHGAQDYLPKSNTSPRSLERAILYALERSRMLKRIKELQERLMQAERDRVLMETAGAAAHEIYQPLTALLGLSSVMLQELPEDSPLREHLQTIREASSRIQQIVEKMRSAKHYASKSYLEGVDIVDFEAAGTDETDRQNPADTD